MKEGLEKDQSKKEHLLIKENCDPSIDNVKKKIKEEKPSMKVVVRRLPPTMTEATFKEQVSPLPPHDYMYFVQADSSLAPFSFCRAYINFISTEDLFMFTEKFDNYVFVDSKGQEYPAVVEFAPFQRIPKHRPNRKKDPKMGTIEQNQAYIEFKERLEAEMLESKTAANAVKQHFFETSNVNEEKKEVTTPLLDFVRHRRVERQRIREEKREEKRKRDLERRRAKDEQRKTRKDEDNPVLKLSSSNQDLNHIEKSLPKHFPIRDMIKLLSTDSKMSLSTSCPVVPLENPIEDFQKNILLTSESKNGTKKANSDENKITAAITNYGQIQKLQQNEKKQHIKLTDLGSKDINTTYTQQVTILKNPFSDVVKGGLRNKDDIHNKSNDFLKGNIQIMKPLHRLLQKGEDEIAFKEKRIRDNTKGFVNLNNVVKTGLKNDELAYNTRNKANDVLENITILKTESESFDKNIAIKSFNERQSPPSIIRRVTKKGFSSCTWNATTPRIYSPRITITNLSPSQHTSSPVHVNLENSQHWGNKPPMHISRRNKIFSLNAKS
uniref:UPF3 domain-containing protein n=1 Tax=Clastoptera arizonana TaxID=38151 RepID=A0A1B6CBU0_9HEMI